MTDKITLKHDGWLVVADGEKALFLRNEGDEKFPNLAVFREQQQENPANRDQGADAPGRFNDGGPGTGSAPHRSAVAETDWHRLQKDRFAAELADILYKQAHKGRFEELVLVAAPGVLGQMRKELHQEVAGRIVGEVDKDLTNHPVGEIEKLVLHSEG
ncbi:host attachment family protein [Oceaniradius stylonematis]|jgi:protein required for attachment to host cells|uniref:host attachment family protein n=1 Tax=Oceaniradius stylonematis TaxID=2184161 RepID=UPI00273E6CF6|nr:host attachment family protein [Oceaniradius stylonematis]